MRSQIKVALKMIKKQHQRLSEVPTTIPKEVLAENKSRKLPINCSAILELP